MFVNQCCFNSHLFFCSTLKYPRRILPLMPSTILIFICLTWARTTLREASSASTSMCQGKGLISAPQLNQLLLVGNIHLSLSLSPSLTLYSSGASHLRLLGAVQDKVTVCATNDSYQVTRERMTQVVEDTRERGTKVIKPGGQYRGKGLSRAQVGHQCRSVPLLRG